MIQLYFVTMKLRGTINTAMLLAAGFGTRMKELSVEVPKPLLPLNDHRIIDIILLKLAASGIKRVVINLHYLGDRIEAYVGNGKRHGLEILYSREEILLDTGGGIALAESLFSGETILVVNSDVLSNISLSALFDFHDKQSANATMAVTPSKNNRDYSLVLYDGQNRLLGFLGKGATIPENCRCGIFIGYQVLTPPARAYLKPQVQSIIDGFYRPALARRDPITVFPFEGEWIDLGTREQYLTFKRDLQSRGIDLNTFLT